MKDEKWVNLLVKVKQIKKLQDQNLDKNKSPTEGSETRSVAYHKEKLKADRND